MGVGTCANPHLSKHPKVLIFPCFVENSGVFRSFNMGASSGIHCSAMATKCSRTMCRQGIEHVGGKRAACLGKV